jgi:hypothetical protein
MKPVYHDLRSMSVLQRSAVRRAAATQIILNSAVVVCVIVPERTGTAVLD